jgi:hypothetical protein
LVAAAQFGRAADPLLPDLMPWAEQSKCYMYCGFVDGGHISNKVVYRFNATTANIGLGPLEIRNTAPSLPQDLFQRIYDTEGGVTEQLIASFPDAFKIDNRNQYLPGFSFYHLRTVLPENGVGPIVSTHDKTSRAVVDSTAYNLNLPNAPNQRVYNDSTANTLGISVGWADVYALGLPGQWIEVTGLSPGQYWLEMIVDPHNLIQESDETNNIARIMVTLNSVPNPLDQPGDFDRDDEVDAADYVLWRNTLGTVNQLPLKAGIGADGDANNRIDAPDYDVWRTHFGVVNAGSSALASVPEPTTALLLLGFVVVAKIRRRRGCI